MSRSVAARRHALTRSLLGPTAAGGRRAGTLGRAFAAGLRRARARVPAGRPRATWTSPTRRAVDARAAARRAVGRRQRRRLRARRRRRARRRACWRANVAGPVNAGRRLPAPRPAARDLLVGPRVRRRATAAPTSKTTSRRPLNVYGATKAEAERRVLDLLPDALVGSHERVLRPVGRLQLSSASVLQHSMRGGAVLSRRPIRRCRRPTCPTW